MTDFNGLWIEGKVVEVISDTRVTLTWGGSDGLKPGQSIVRFTLTAAIGGTIVRVSHSRLPDPAGDLHRLAWRQAGLARLKTVIEGGTPGGTFLGDIADARELAPYLARFSGAAKGRRACRIMKLMAGRGAIRLLLYLCRWS